MYEVVVLVYIIAIVVGKIFVDGACGIGSYWQDEVVAS